MSTRYICDGCGKPIDGDPVRLGHVIVRDYDAECAKRAQAFLDDEAMARVTFAAQFLAARSTLIESYAGFKLPDLP